MAHNRSALLLPRLQPLIPVVAVLLLQGARASAVFDDAYITFRYARNIVSRLGFVYNPGDRVLGTTTPLFTGILAFFGYLTDPSTIPSAAIVLSLVFDCVSAWLVFRLVKTAFNDPSGALMVSVTWAAHPFRLAIATGGMEASLFTLLVLVSFERLVLARSLVPGSIAASLAFLTRPDAAIALAPVFAYLFLRDRRFALKSSASVAVLVAPWIGWATAYFGSPLPNSLFAKGVAYSFFPGFAAYFILPFLGTGTIAQFTITPGLIAASILGPTVIAVGVAHVARQAPTFISLATIGPLFLIIMALANAPMFFPWYYYPLLPSLIFSIACCAWFLPIRSHRVRRLLLGVTLVLTLAIPAGLIRYSPSWPLSREREAAYHEACRFLKSTVRTSDVILAPDIGVLGWCLPDSLILDPIGLVSPDAIPYLPVRPQGPAIPVELVLSARPDYIVALDQYTAPFLQSSTEFSRLYRLAWSRPVTIAGRTQPLHVYAATSQPDASAPCHPCFEPFRDIVDRFVARHR